MKKLFLLLIYSMLLLSCGYEPIASVDYTFNNKTDSPISLILNHSYEIKRDTINIGPDSFHVLEFSYEDHKSPPSPFSHEGIDTIFLVVNETLHTSYHKGSPGKSPFSIDSYKGGHIKSKRGSHSYSYVYDIDID